jgi:hypothetical protein
MCHNQLAVQETVFLAASFVRFANDSIVLSEVVGLKERNW